MLSLENLTKEAQKNVLSYQRGVFLQSKTVTSEICGSFSMTMPNCQLGFSIKSTFQNEKKSRIFLCWVKGAEQ